MKSVHIMLDLETLGTTPGSVILSIGACVFDENGPSENPAHRFHEHINLEASVACGFEMDPETVLWWMNPDRSPARQQVIAGQEHAESPRWVIDRFIEWLDAVAPDIKTRHIWAKGPSFDCGLLAAAVRLLPGCKLVWRYSNERCVRTVADERPDIAEPVREGVHHSALDDALHQARHVGLIFAARRRDREELATLRATGSAGGSPAVSEAQVELDKILIEFGNAHTIRSMLASLRAERDEAVTLGTELREALRTRRDKSHNDKMSGRGEVQNG